MLESKYNFGKPGDLTDILISEFDDLNIPERSGKEEGERSWQYKVLSNPNLVSEIFSSLDNRQVIWHNSLDTADENTKSGLERFKTNVVVHSFDDGWTVAYLPAAGEAGMPSIKGQPGLSHDRILVGDDLGVCFGGCSTLYQDNSSGRIYVIRDDKGKSRVAIRINNRVSGNSLLQEAKGKSNNSPDIEAAAKAEEWFLHLSSLNEYTLDNKDDVSNYGKEIEPISLEFQHNGDYQNFPPLTIEAVKSFISFLCAFSNLSILISYLASSA